MAKKLPKSPSNWYDFVVHHVWPFPDSKVHGANMGPTWVLSAPDVGPMDLAIRVVHARNSSVGKLHPNSFLTSWLIDILLNSCKKTPSLLWNINMAAWHQLWNKYFHDIFAWSVSVEVTRYLWSNTAISSPSFNRQLTIRMAAWPKIGIHANKVIGDWE